MAEFHPLKSGGVELLKFGVASLGLDPQKDADRSAYIATTIQELLQEHGVKPGPALLSVSGQSVFSRFVKLPPVDKDKIYQIILYEAQQNVPFPMDEVVWDYQLIGGGEEGEIDVMLAAIKAEIIEDLTDGVEEAGLTADLVDVAPMTLYNAVRYNYGDLDGCTLVVDIGARSTDLIFIEGDRVFIRSVPVAGNAITQQIMREFDTSFNDAEEIKKTHAFVSFGPAYEKPDSETADRVSKGVRTIMTRMHAEINRSINFYRSQQSGSSPSLILLTGGSSVIPYTETFFKEKLKIDVDYLNPFLNVAVNESIDTDLIARHAHELGEVVGLGLRRILTCPIEINLMPKKVLEDRAFRKRQPMIILALFGLAVILGIWCSYFFKLTSLTQARLAKVQDRLQELQSFERRLKTSEDELASVQGKIDTLLKRGQQRSDWLRVVDEIHQCLPEGMWLISLGSVNNLPKTDSLMPPGGVNPVMPTSGTPEGKNRVELMGLAYVDKVTGPGPIREFRDALRESPLFSDETEITWSPSPGPGDFTREYKIVAVLEEPLAP